MSGLQMIYLVSVFCAAFCFTMLLLLYLVRSPVQRRLRQIGAVGAIVRLAPAGGRAVAVHFRWSHSLRSLAWMAKLLRPLAKLSVPAQDRDKMSLQTSLRARFLNAGFRAELAPAIYFGAKTLLAISAPGLMWLVLIAGADTLAADVMMLCLAGAAAAGFYAPDLILGRMVKARQREIIENFPDALDLMTICIEAGLGVDAAIARVAEEMTATAAVLSEELYLVTLELRAGSSKGKALRNLALRTGIDDVDTFVAILIQAERFGTGIGNALRVHSDGLRTRRRQQAEEAAAKIALKLLFPLVFCIFPALLLVLLGPAMIHVYRVLLPSIAG
jgi:tight adherence protein C